MISKLVYLVIYLVATMITIIMAIRVAGKKASLAKPMFRVLLLASFTMIFYVMTMLTNNYHQMSMAYSAMFITIDWMLFELLVFSSLYVGSKKVSPVIRYIVIIALVIDCLFQAVNPFCEISNTYRVFRVGGDVYLSILGFWPYKIHLLLCYLMVIGTLAYFIWKTFAVPAMYCKKYSLIALSIILIAAMNGVFIYTPSYIDFSMLLYAVAAIAVVFFAFDYRPRNFVLSAQSELFNKTDDAAVIFDNKNRLITYNATAQQMFGLEREAIPELEYTLREFLQAHAIIQLERTEQDTYFEWQLRQEGTTRYFNVGYRRMLDKHKRLIGSFIMFHDTTQRKYLESYDRLTGIYNRDFFSKMTRKLLDQYGEGHQYKMVVFDIQSFKVVNETLGNEKGNQVLRIIAALLYESRRVNSTFGRLSGDYFILCHEEQDEIFYLLEKAINKRCHNQGIQIEIRIIAGVYPIEDRNIAVEIMVERALLALREIKGNYIKKISYYDHRMSDQLLKEQVIVNEMKEALEQGQFEVFLQPQYNAQTGVMSGSEALVRWNHPQRGYIPPFEFISVFEKNGFISQLDAFVWERSCQYLHRWIQEGRDMSSLSISVNISRMDMYYLDIKKVLSALMSKYELPMNLLKLEFTESAYIAETGHLAEIIGELRGMGFVTEMDDFGSGYSSLNALKNAPVDVLKLDMNFIRGSSHEARGQQIIQSVVSMASHLELQVIAEGVETEDQAKFIRDIGCHFIQGYYYAKPMNINDFEKKYFSLTI